MPGALLQYQRKRSSEIGHSGVLWISRPDTGSRTGPVRMEWELRGEARTDEHAHDEYAPVSATRPPRTRWRRDA